MKTILKKNKVAHVAYFMKSDHGFTTILPLADEKAATLSWTRTIDFKRN
jgi:carboxymethylenebutenolidase